ncbi:hypothetical protein ElyMa_001801700, partial [Elysia marginata]
GNYVMEKPYSMGESCSNCPIKAGYCVKGLCSKRPKIGGNAGEAAHRNIVVISLSVVVTFFLSTLHR